MLRLYKAYIETVIQNGVLVYDTSAKTNLKLIDWLQNRIVRIFSSNRISESVREIRIRHKLYSIGEKTVA